MFEHALKQETMEKSELVAMRNFFIHLAEKKEDANKAEGPTEPKAAPAAKKREPKAAPSPKARRSTTSSMKAELESPTSAK